MKAGIKSAYLQYAAVNDEPRTRAGAKGEREQPTIGQRLGLVKSNRRGELFYCICASSAHLMAAKIGLGQQQWLHRRKEEKFAPFFN